MWTAVLMGLITLPAACSGDDDDASSSTSTAVSAGTPSTTQNIPSASAAPTFPASTSEATGWLRVEPTAVWFLTLLGDSTLAGTSNLTRLSDDGLTIERLDEPISGTRDGNQILVTVYRQTWNGRLEGDRLLLTVTRPNGELVDATFFPGDAAAYNAAVRSLNELAAAGQQAAADDRARLAAEKAAQETLAAFAARTQTVVSNTARLADQHDLADPVGSAETARSGLTAAIATLDDVDCFDAEFAASDLTLAADDLLWAIGEQRYTIESLGLSIDTLRDSIAALDGYSSTPDSEAAVNSANNTIANVESDMATWSTQLDSVEQAVIADARAALSRSVQRCGTTVTWEPAAGGN